MVRKLIVTIAMVMSLVAAGCGEKQQVAVWGLSSPAQDLTARVGVNQGNAEIGFTAKYDAADDVEWNNLKPNDVGAYVLFFPTQEASITDTPSPSPIGPLLESLNARPYGGIELIGPLEGSGRSVRHNFIVGSEFTIDAASNIGLVVEYIDGDAIDTGEVYIGGVLRF